jgi:hypothetical protein
MSAVRKQPGGTLVYSYLEHLRETMKVITWNVTAVTLICEPIGVPLNM